ncbi:OLC1v1038491C1 [Oldenlandia corymbosa var. corymbosa]|uniref:PRA1 family protein n=1 Tax=Oldenlandia corymbosa var. corymbosa TaxID=529605 RepID=A0AAV1D044_OLDCO|nr:OLC1v1038491C1 [Oldenlandia corymbosa var. corymbosa]
MHSQRCFSTQINLFMPPNFGPVQRPSSSSTSKMTVYEKEQDSTMKSAHQKHPDSSSSYTFNFTFPLSIPSTPEKAAIRIVKNMVSFGLCYLLFVYVVLFITLIPARKVSLTILAGIKEIGFLYLIFLRCLPKSLFLNHSVFKFLVLFALCVTAGVLMIVTKAGLHLLIVLVSAIPVILFHATLWREELNFGTNKNDEIATLVKEDDNNNSKTTYHTPAGETVAFTLLGDAVDSSSV